MFYKRIVYLWIGLLVAIVIGIVGLLILVDPIDFWGSPVIRGFNHYKIKQGNFLDVCKPYEYARLKPDIVYIGTSRVYVGIPPEHPGVPDEEVFNMGLSSLSLSDMQQYLRFMYKVHKPKKIYIGLDFYQFGKKGYALQRTGFSQERLNILSWGFWPQKLYSLYEGIAYLDMVWPTIKASQTHQAEGSLFLRGWDVKRGSFGKIEEKEYYRYLNQLLFVDYGKWQYEPKTMCILEEIIAEGKEAGVTIQLFFSPISIDTHLVLDITGKSVEWYGVKRKVAALASVYDSALVNPVTQKRAYFYDALHFRQELGSMMSADLQCDKQNFGVLLSSVNIDSVLQKEQESWHSWKDEHETYALYLQERYNANSQIEDGTLQEFIGF